MSCGCAATHPFLHVVCILRARQRTQNAHNMSYNLGSPQATHLYGAIAPQLQNPQTCHPERSEGSPSIGREIFRFAQDDRGRAATGWLASPYTQPIEA